MQCHQQLPREARPAVEHGPDHPEFGSAPLVVRDLVEHLERLDRPLQGEGAGLDDEQGVAAGVECIGAEHPVRPGGAVEEHVIEADPDAARLLQRQCEPALRVDQAPAHLLEFRKARLCGEERDPARSGGHGLREARVFEEHVRDRRPVRGAPQPHGGVGLRVEVHE